MFDLILTVSVVVVSAFALGVAIYNIIDTRKNITKTTFKGKDMSAIKCSVLNL